MALEDIIVRVSAQLNQSSFGKVMKQVNKLKTMTTPINKAFSSIDEGMRQKEKSISNSTKAIGDRLKKEESLMKDYSKGVRESISGTRTPDMRGIGEGISEKVMSNQKQQKQYWDNYFKGVSNAKKVTTGFRGQLNSLTNRLGIVNKATALSEQRFQGWALSIMFAGMAIKRAFMGVWKSASKTFTEIQGSTEGSTDGFTKLQGSMKYLWFSVGQALEPLAEALIPIVDSITNWVQQNPKLTKQIVKWGAILGSALMFIGGVRLAISGLVSGISKLILSIIKVIDWLKTLKSIKMASWFTTLKGGFVSLGTYLSGKFKTAIKWIRNNPVKSLMGAAAVTGIIVALGWLNRLQKNMGGWDELFKNAGRGAMRFGAKFSAAITAVIQKAKDMWRAIRGEDTSGLTFKDFYGAKLEENLKKIEDDFGKPSKGYVDDARTLSEIWSGEIYPEVEKTGKEVEKMMRGTPSKTSDISSGGNGTSSLKKQPIVIEMDGEKVGRLTSRRILREVNNSTRTTSE